MKIARRVRFIVVISQDLDELLTLADRIAVINEGALSRILVVGEASIDEIGMLMGGVHGEPGQRQDEGPTHHVA